LKQLDGIETVVMIRKYESEHLASYKKSLNVLCPEDQHCKSMYEARQGADERIIFQSSPVNIAIIECIADRIAGERSLKTLPGLARYGRPVNTFAWPMLRFQFVPWAGINMRRGELIWLGITQMQ
jgi:hypothetical protein